MMAHCEYPRKGYFYADFMQKNTPSNEGVPVADACKYCGG